MKTRYLFSLAALALLTAACSSDETALTPAEQPAPAKERIPFTAVIGSTATTRVLAEAENGETITAKWQKGEKIALIHGEDIDTLEVSNVDATTGAATITGDITSPTNNEAVTVVYVGHQLGCMGEFVKRLKQYSEDLNTGNPEQTGISIDIIKKIINERLEEQDGTLETISNKLDCRYTTSTLAVSDGKATFGSEVKMSPCFTIWKVNLTDEYGSPIYSRYLRIVSMRADYTYVGDFTISLQGDTTSSTFYVALIPDLDTIFNFSAEMGSHDYSGNCYLKAPLEIGLFYTSTVKIERNDYAG